MISSYFRAFDMLTDEDVANLVQVSAVRKLNKSAFFIQEGDVCREVAFVAAGILRSFYVADNGEEITYCLTFPNALTTAYSSFITGLGTPETIQAITPVELVVIPKKEIDALAGRYANWALFLKATAEQQYLELEKRVFQLQKSSATKRYQNLMTSNPAYLQEVPLQYLASYLGITQRHLSRIRREVF